jgi:phenylacetate-CoA ligase
MSTSLERFLYRNVLRGYESIVKRRSTWRYWRELEHSQWLTAAELEALQTERLRRLMAHAFARSEYFSKEWRARGLDPAGIESTADLARWPIVSRRDIRENRAQMRTTDAKTIVKSTGGSSGEPLRFDIDEESYQRRMGMWFRGYGWAGAEPGSKQLYLWGTAIGRRSWLAHVKDAAYNAMNRKKVVSCFDADSTLARRFLGSLESCRPDCIVAYTNPLYDIAREMEGSGRGPGHKPRSIIVGAEKIHDFQRAVIERVFGAPVFETYGSREFMLIGAECDRHAGLHLSAENLIVEIVDESGSPVAPGVEGNVVITDLTNYAMPFVRYENGDRAVMRRGTCACGRSLPMLEKVVGRRLDVLLASHGRRIPGEFFPHLVKDYQSVRRFQVVQERADLVRFLIEGDAAASAERESLQRLVREAFGPEVRVEFEPVDRISLTQASKRQVVVNRVATGGLT